jgi:hypothetical protein
MGCVTFGLNKGEIIITMISKEVDYQELILIFYSFNDDVIFIGIEI